MEYNIETVIKRLQKARKGGKVLITESELISIATTKINKVNDINKQIERIDSGLKKIIKYGYNEYVSKENCITFSSAENLTGIPRQTFYRWEKEGIITRYKGDYECYVFNLKELKEKLLSMQKQHRE